MRDLAGDRPSHMFASLFFPSRHFCVLPPVDPQAAAGHGGRQEVSAYCWLTSYLLSSRLSAELPSERVGCIQSEPGEKELV